MKFPVHDTVFGQDYGTAEGAAKREHGGGAAQPAKKGMMPRVTGQNNYEWTHGKKPRGEGSWGFKHNGGAIHGETTWHQGTFGNAAKAAQKHGQMHGSHEVEVQT